MMTMNDQIKDEKLQYNINREAAKISVLSSGKLHKYEYIPGEDILLSNQQQIIGQTKFTYSPLGKAFDKQIKTIEDQGKNQVDALNTLKSDNKITIKKYTYDLNDTPFISKQKEMFNKLVDEKLEKITAKQFSGFNLLSLSNSKNRRLKKEVSFLCTLVAK